MKISDADIDKISIMRDEGMTTRKIAEEFGVAYGTMCGLINRLMKQGEIGKIHRCMQWTQERVDELVRMKSGGATVDEITKHFDVSFGAIRGKIAALVSAGKLPCEYNKWKGNGLFEYLDAHNLCHRCYRNEKFGSYNYCPSCMERDSLRRGKYPNRSKDDLREMRKVHKENGICIDCSKPATHGLYCYEHMIARKKSRSPVSRKSAARAYGRPDSVRYTEGESPMQDVRRPHRGRQPHAVLQRLPEEAIGDHDSLERSDEGRRTSF